MSAKKDFEKLFREFSPAVFRFVYLKTSDFEIAQDLTQETFIRIWQIMKNGKTIKNPKFLVYKIANGKIIDHYRRKKSKKVVSISKVDERLMADFDKTEELVNSRQKIDKVFEKLKELNRIHQEVLILYYIEEIKIPEISALLNKSENSVRVLIHRALKSLKKKL